MSVLPGFVKAQSDNLPKIDSIAMFSFLRSNTDFVGAEMRGVKAKRSGRESYGDNAIGYVQVKRENDICTVKAKITPEHRISKKAYEVTLRCNEVEEEVISVQCNDCAASLGGCKHAIALLMWVHRRSEEPAVTSVSCYWKKAKLSNVGKSLSFIKGKDLGKNPVTPLPPSSGAFLNSVLQTSKALDVQDTVLTKFFKTNNDVEQLSLHNLSRKFFHGQHGGSAEDFLTFCSAELTEDICIRAEEKTLQQSESNIWYELRYGRITASKAHEAAHCHTFDGSLVETVFGASTFKRSLAMARGIHLEKSVRTKIEQKKNIKINLCGFKTSAQYPVLGASPDGITDDFVIEIKCPSSEKAMKTYISSGKICEKYKAQMQLQMFFFKKQQGLFCVAHPNFEKSRNISILVVDFDVNDCTALINKCINFWKCAIFPIMEKNYK